MTPATIFWTLVTAAVVTATGWVWSLLLLPSTREGRRTLGAGVRAVVSVGLGAILVPLALFLASLLLRAPITVLLAAITITLLLVFPLPFVWREIRGPE